MTAEAARSRAEAQDVLYETHDEIGVITFNRPATRNALTFAMYDRLAEICRAVTAEPSVGALVVTGAGGRAFAAGTDISSFRNISSPADALAYERRINEVLDSIERCPVLTAPDDATRNSRLALSDLTARVLQRGLDLLGIQTVEQM